MIWKDENKTKHPFQEIIKNGKLDTEKQKERTNTITAEFNKIKFEDKHYA